MRNSTRVLMIAVSVILGATVTQAATPQLINYQGVIESGGGAVADGAYSMRFFIYDAEIGGSTKWVELNPSVQVTDGRFNVLLGSIEPIEDSVFNNEERWLEVLFVAEVLAPRIRLVTSPYAHRVSTIDGTTGGDVTGDVTVTSSSNGNTFEVSNNGLGRAGRFAVNNPANTSAAVSGFSFGTVAGEFFNDGGGNALNAWTTGTGRGVEAASDFGTAVYGTSGNGAPLAIAVHGVLTSTDAGLLSSAVYGQNMASDDDGIGVSGTHAGGGWGVYGAANEATGGGVYGQSTNGTGVHGFTSNGTGVIGENTTSSSNSYGVHGILNNSVSGSFSAGVWGENRGTSITGVGVYGSHDGGGWGVYGVANDAFGRGVYGISTNGVGVYGQSASGLSGFFNGTAQVVGGSDVSSGSQSNGYLIVGQGNGANIAIDNNEIIARDNGATTLLHLQADGGQVGIGTQSLTVPAGYILGVDGKAIMEEVEVQLSQDWPDYVFADDYDLMSLDQLQNHIDTYKRLPGLPSATEMEGRRLALGEMQTKLLEKVEELTLHVLTIKTDLDRANAENAELRSRLDALESETR